MKMFIKELLKKIRFNRLVCIKCACTVMLSALFLCAEAQKGYGQSKKKLKVPEWALPGSATHEQVPPPPNFHRPTRTLEKKIGIFDGQSDVGAALVAGSSRYNPSTKKYTIRSAGYNIWYTRDEFRYLWKKMSGDVTLAADISFPDTAGYDDRKAVVIIRQDLDDNSKEAMVALHGGGLLHLAWRPEKGQEIKEIRVDTKSLTSGNSPSIVHAKRIGIVKQGDDFFIFVSMTGEAMRQYGSPAHLHIDGPFYVGIGFCSHQPITKDTAILSDVVLKNSASLKQP